MGKVKKLEKKESKFADRVKLGTIKVPFLNRIIICDENGQWLNVNKNPKKMSKLLHPKKVAYKIE